MEGQVEMRAASPGPCTPHSDGGGRAQLGPTTPKSHRFGRQELPDPMCSPIPHHSPFPDVMSPPYRMTPQHGMTQQHCMTPQHGMTPQHCTTPQHGMTPQHSTTPQHGMTPQHSMTPQHGMPPQHGMTPQGGTPLTAPSPSPGSRKFVGVSSNARNDIYMKTLMNSPYHKNFTPLSATPNGKSPTYQTPVRTRAEQPGSPARGPVCTPSGSQPMSCEKKFVTPKNIVFNPFESGIDNLHLPTYISPGFFTVMSTPASEEKKTFQWSIEHIAELNPADIEEMPLQQIPMAVDRETEERAQKAIDQFFSSNCIVPSPWTDPKQRKVKNVLPATPASQGGVCHEMMTELQGSIQKSLPKHGMEDVACQTALSLPVNFDLQKVLGAYMTQDTSAGTGGGAGDEGNQQEMLSTSSLRRKLFFHGDTSSLAPSPVKGVAGDHGDNPGSPMFGPQASPAYQRVSPLKNTPAFSSSPIKSTGTPKYNRRCSSDPEFLVSPELSPIVHGNLHNPVHKSRSSGLFEVHHGSLNLSPVSDDDEDDRPCSLVSPIPFYGLSPEDGEDNNDFRPKFADSPGFSPIRPAKKQIRKILRRSQEESYLQDEGCSSSDDERESVTPVSTDPRKQSNSLTPVARHSPTHKTPTQTTAAFISKSHSCTDLKEIAMDYETGDAAPRGVGKDHNMLTSSLCESRDFSSTSQDDTHIRTHSSSQDTGYQTASLQSTTNPESVLLHTNLTNQFGSLPFNLTNQDAALQQTANQDSAPILNLFSSFSSPEEKADSKKGGLSISKQLFPDDAIFPDSPLMLGEEEHEESTPKHAAAMFHDPRNDSALVDDSAILMDSGVRSMDLDFKKSDFTSVRSMDLEFKKSDFSDVRSMDLDFKKGDLSVVMTEGEEIISRAREALAMANSLYPQQEGKGELPRPCIPTKHQGEVEETATLEKRVKEPSGSEIAYNIIQRAGEDLAKYGNFLSYKKSSEQPT